MGDFVIQFLLSGHFEVTNTLRRDLFTLYRCTDIDPALQISFLKLLRKI